MKVISVPRRLRYAAWVLFLSVPLAALEVVVAARAPWWRIPIRSIVIWSSLTVLICIPLALWISAGRRWAWNLAAVAGFLWSLLTAWVGLRTRNPSLGFFTLLLALYWTGLLLWIRHELGRSFFDPRLSWYQGLPKPIPGLGCTIAGENGSMTLKVSRMDRDGAFLFNEKGENVPLKKGRETELVFRYRERLVKCSGLLVRVLSGGDGAGVQFQKMSPDGRKQIGDFVEMLRGEGHA